MQALKHLMISLAVILSSATAWAGPININLATAAELDRELHGVGPALAARIVNYRERHGAFSQPEDIQEVPYVGSRTYMKNRELILVEG